MSWGPLKGGWGVTHPPLPMHLWGRGGWALVVIPPNGALGQHDTSRSVYVPVACPARTASGLCTWVRAMFTYHHIAKFVAPKIEALREAEGKLRVANAKLQSKEVELAKVEKDSAECQARLDAAKKKKQDLQDDAERTKKRMEAANGLIDALSGERDRWTVCRLRRRCARDRDGGATGDAG